MQWLCMKPLNVRVASGLTTFSVLNWGRDLGSVAQAVRPLCCRVIQIFTYLFTYRP